MSYGFSNLHGLGPRPGGPVSGWGFELTFRLATTQKIPPAWPVALMQFLAVEVFKTENPLAAGEFVDLGEPLPAKTETQLCALGLVEDPVLERGESPSGPSSSCSWSASPATSSISPLPGASPGFSSSPRCAIRCW